MMSKCFVTIGTAVVIVFGGSAHSYEVQTHENLTRNAYDQSILADPVASPLLAFGVEDQGEARFFPRPIGGLDPIRLTLRNVMARGAHQEDIPTAEGRFLNHFYDPQMGGIGLDVPTLDPGLPSPDWVLEDQGSVPAQQDSLRDALEFHRLALTLPQQNERDMNLVRLIEILGRSVHHLQDMSQPAHVRNDAHPPWDFDILESFTNELYGKEGDEDSMPRNSPYASGAVDLGTFDMARKFWSNSGRGIAEFTSNNFVSSDTNFRGSPGALTTDSVHHSPVPTGTHSRTLSELNLTTQLPGWTRMIFVHTQVHDAYSNQSRVNDYASTWSLFSPDLESFGVLNVMTQNRFNFEKNYEFLFPRAIAYSAGLINYYFRGRMKVEDISSSGGVTTITVRNGSAPDFALGAGLPGFRLFYDAADGQRRELDVEELDNPGAAMPFDATRRFSFTTPADVDVRKQAQYVLMFDGAIGTEVGVAAVAFGAPNTGFSVVPNYVTADGVSGARRVVWSSNAWTTANDSEYWAGPIDWKGHKPEDVLTWGSGNRRYHYSSIGGPVYMNGRVLTSGPGFPIAGASIRYIDGLRILNVACVLEGHLQIYSRMFAERYDNEEMWSTENPLGWRLVYSGVFGEAFTGFFFNASGTEGQFITRNPNTLFLDRRVQVTLSGFTATMVDFPAVATVTQTKRDFRQNDESASIAAGYCFVSPGYPNGNFTSSPDDSCQRREYSASAHRVNRETITEAYADRTLFCVDYRGDEEVFCELLSPSASLVSSSVKEVTVQQQQRYSNGYCGGTNNADIHYTETTTKSIRPERVMKIGSLEIPWTATAGMEHMEAEQWGGQFADPKDYSGSSQSQTTHINRRTRLVQVDPRHDFAIYEEYLSNADEEYASGFTQDGGLPDNYSRDTTVSERVIMRLGGDQQLLFENITPQSDNTTGITHPPSVPAELVDPCSPGSPLSETSTVTTFLDRAAASDALAEIYSSMSTHGAYAIDRAGRLALSQHITGVSDASVSHGYRNVLTGGDLPTLMPGTPSSEGYRYSIRLVR